MAQAPLPMLELAAEVLARDREDEPGIEDTTIGYRWEDTHVGCEEVTAPAAMFHGSSLLKEPRVWRVIVLPALLLVRRGFGCTGGSLHAGHGSRTGVYGIYTVRVPVARLIDTFCKTGAGSALGAPWEVLGHEGSTSALLKGAHDFR